MLARFADLEKSPEHIHTYRIAAENPAKLVTLDALVMKHAKI